MIPSAIVNPQIVFKVLSASSDSYDRGLKFEFYSALNSLRSYVLVDQFRKRIEVRSRADASSAWTYTVLASSEDELFMEALDIRIPMSGIYRNWEAEEIG